MAEQPRSEADAVAALAARAAEPRLISVTRGDEGATSVLVAPVGMNVFSIKKFVDEHLPHPERRRGTAHFQELSSFIEHTNTFKGADSVVFGKADAHEPSLTSVLDYNASGPDDEQVKARHGQHRGVYHFPLADEWKTWTGADGKAMSQVAFAEFLESNICDVVDPESAGDNAKLFALNTGLTFASPSRLLAISKGLAITSDARAATVLNLSSGEVQVSYSEVHKDAGGEKLTVPGALLVLVPVFRSGFAYQIPVRLRYRLKEGAVTWSFAMYRRERYLDDAFQGACVDVRERTKLPLFMGAPES